MKKPTATYSFDDSREKSLALTSLDEVVFWAIAAMARHG